MGTLQKLKAKTVLNADKATQEAVKNPMKPTRLEDKKQSGFASTTVASKYMGGVFTHMTIPKKRTHKKKGWQK